MSSKLSFLWWVFPAALLALVVWVGVSALGSDPRAEHKAPVSEGQKDFPRTIVVDSGRKVVIPTRPVHILASDCATADVLVGIVDPQRIAAIPQAVNDYGGAAEFYRTHPDIPRFLKFNAETVLSLRPDLFFFTAYREQSVIPIVESHGIPVIEFENFRTFAGIRASIISIGAATGDDDKAAQLAQEFDRRLKAIESAVASAEKPRVLGYSRSGDTAFIVGTGESQDEVLRRAGAVNVAAELNMSGHPNFSFEQLLKADPDWLVVFGDEGMKSQQAQYLLTEPALAGLKAVKSRHIAVIPDRYYTAISQFVVDAVEILAKQLHPEKF